MQKHNLLAKKIKRQILSINDSIENYFNQVKLLIKNIKKSKFDKDNKVILGSAILVLFILSYFLIPTIYDKDLIGAKIKNQIFNRYDIEIKFNDKIYYSLLPKPGFTSKNISIIHNKKIIGNVKNFKIYISVKDLFSFKKFDTKDIVFEKTDFDLKKEDLKFFKKLLDIQPSKNKIIIRNSKIFFRDKNDEILFLNKIYNSKLYYDSKNLKNVFVSKNEVFNVPYKITFQNDKFRKLFTSEFSSKKIRLNLENAIDYKNLEKKIGIFEILFINKNTSLNYIINKNNLVFNSKDNKNNFNGFFDFKPFYLSMNVAYDGLSLKNLFNESSIIIDLIKTELLNNENLNAKIGLDIKKIINIDELKDLSLMVTLEEGNINISDSSIMWKDDLKINLSESFINFDLNGVSLIGRMILEFKNLENFYRSFQIKKSDRKIVNKIDLDFNYNLDNKKISFDNVKIDNSSNLEIQKFIENFNSKKNMIINKVTFKNFINNFFSVYAG